MFIKSSKFSDSELDKFRELQQLSFSILENMASELTVGLTEKEVAGALVRRYRDAGFTSFFHLPVVLFGERAALPGNFTVGKFFPKSRALQEGDSVVLDASPIADGYLVDTSYSFCLGECDNHRRMMFDLARFRDQVCTAVNEGQTFKDIAESVEQEIQQLGYESVHNKHPGEVLGHRAVKLPVMPFDWRLNGFDATSLSWFAYKDKIASIGLGKEAPLWNTSKNSDHAPHDGLWLVEPHAGLGAVGAKWEEILVIDDGEAYWLEDEPPHVRQWQQIVSQQSYSPIPA
ncbi:MAG: M24 family metallopeptidase [Pseudomonadota bacterium]